MILREKWVDKKPVKWTQKIHHLSTKQKNVKHATHISRDCIPAPRNTPWFIYLNYDLIRFWKRASKKKYLILILDFVSKETGLFAGDTAIPGQPVVKAEQAPNTLPSSKNQFDIIDPIRGRIRY